MKANDIDFIAQYFSTTKVKASKFLADFAKQQQEALQVSGMVKIAGIGTITKHTKEAANWSLTRKDGTTLKGTSSRRYRFTLTPSKELKAKVAL